MLLNSAAKPLAMCDVLACEYDARGPGLRAVVLCDSEHPPRQTADSPLALTGGGRGLLASLGADERFVGTRPALVTGETFAVLPGDADWWAERSPRSRAGRSSRRGCGASRGKGWWCCATSTRAFGSQAWTAWATQLLADGETLVLFGTRGLLGEGWDCPQVNVLVDMTAVAADVAVRQMRGRSLRLDPGDDRKLANNWDVVCVAPELGRGLADYSRFVRRHAHLHAPCEDGTIETGPSHVHPELSPYGPPAAERFVAINLEQQERAGDRDAARERWGVGEPYRGVDLDALVVRDPRRAGGQGQAALADVRPQRSGGRRWAPPPGWPLRSRGGGGGAARGGRGRAAGRRRGDRVGARRRAPRAPGGDPLEWAAGAVCDAYVALGELTPGSGADAWRSPSARGLGAGEPAGRRPGDQPPGQRGARRALRRRRAAALRRLAQGRDALLQPRPHGVAPRSRRPRAPQGPRGGVPCGVAALVGAASSSTATAPTRAAGARRPGRDDRALETQRRRIWR